MTILIMFGTLIGIKEKVTRVAMQLQNLSLYVKEQLKAVALKMV